LAYRLEYAPAARKAIRAIRDTRLRARIEAALLRLREEPRPAGVKRLVGQEGLLRVRVGDWRILYELREREVIVLVVRIGPRGEVYERLG
jgi:mRNA interferase RelE/StbE